VKMSPRITKRVETMGARRSRQSKVGKCLIFKKIMIIKMRDQITLKPKIKMIRILLKTQIPSKKTNYSSKKTIPNL